MPAFAESAAESKKNVLSQQNWNCWPIGCGENGTSRKASEDWPDQGWHVPELAKGVDSP